MNLDQIKKAVDSGMSVHWMNEGYLVVKDKAGQYLVGFAVGSNRENYVGLTWADGVTMNEKPEDFFISGPGADYYLQDFVDGALNAAIWADLQDEEGEPFQDKGLDDIDPESREKFAKECETFILANVADLRAWEKAGRQAGSAGHDFWLNRCGHGVGFWDRFTSGELKEAGDRMASQCGWRKAFPELDIYLGDDGKVYLSGFQENGGAPK